MLLFEFTLSCILVFPKFSNFIYICDVIFNVFFVGMDNLELIDPVIDAKHRSRLVDGQIPPPLRLRTHDECWRLDARWIPRYAI